MKFLLTVLLAAVSFFASAQERKKVEILGASSLERSEKVPDAQRLIDKVVIRHEGILMYCDSAYTYENSNRVDAFGRVHINQGDTLHLYARKVFYDGDRSFAQAIHNVRLENKGTTLYTDTLDYDMNLKVGYYDTFGKIVDSTNILTSKVGKYYLDEEMIHFTDSVEGNNEKYTLVSDDIKYNTTSEIIYFEGPTTIRDSANTLYAENGWYNTQSGEADLREKPSIYNDTQFVTARQIKYNKEDGTGEAIGQAHLEDYKNKSIVEGNRIAYNDMTQKALATDSAVFISYNETDSLYLHADTLRMMPDTIEDANIVKAYYGVRFYRNDVQGICDSLTYFSADSLVQLHNDPVLWSGIQQLSAQRIEMIQHSATPDEIHLYNNSFIIREQDPERYDQIKGKNMVGFVVEGELQNVDVDGNGQTLYYAREDGKVIGLNRAESSNISIRFRDGEIYKIKFIKQPAGDLKPLVELTEGDSRLPNFKWYGDARPNSKNDIFRKPGSEISTDEKPEKPEKPLER